MKLYDFGFNQGTHTTWDCIYEETPHKCKERNDTCNGYIYIYIDIKIDIILPQKTIITRHALKKKLEFVLLSTNILWTVCSHHDFVNHSILAVN